MKTRHSLTALLLSLTACPDLPDLAEDDAPIAVVEDDPPCGGADLMNDDLNCGACGHECPIVWPDTDYAAGGCVEGECGPRWSGEEALTNPAWAITCEELCSQTEQECVPNGCAGMTGFVCVEVWDYEGACNLGIPGHLPAIELTGSCDAIPPYLEEFDDFGFFKRYVNCCCK